VVLLGLMAVALGGCPTPSCSFCVGIQGQRIGRTQREECRLRCATGDDQLGCSSCLKFEIAWECVRAKCFEACAFLESNTEHSLPRTEMNTIIPSMGMNSDREETHFRTEYPMTHHDRGFGKEFEMGEHESSRGMRGMGSEMGEFHMSKPFSMGFESMNNEEAPVREHMQHASMLSSSFKPLFATNEGKEERLMASSFKPLFSTNEAKEEPSSRSFERLMVSSFKPLFLADTMANTNSNSNEESLSQRDHEFSHWRY